MKHLKPNNVTTTDNISFKLNLKVIKLSSARLI